MLVFGVINIAALLCGVYEQQLMYYVLKMLRINFLFLFLKLNFIKVHETSPSESEETSICAILLLVVFASNEFGNTPEVEIILTKNEI